MSKAENMVPYCARMPRGLLDQAKAAARAEGMGLSELVRHLLWEFVHKDVDMRGRVRVDFLGKCGLGPDREDGELRMFCALRKWARGAWEDVYLVTLCKRPAEDNVWVTEEESIMDRGLAPAGDFWGELLGVEPMPGTPEHAAQDEACARLCAALDGMWAHETDFEWRDMAADVRRTR